MKAESREEGLRTSSAGLGAVTAARPVLALAVLAQAPAG